MSGIHHVALDRAGLSYMLAVDDGSRDPFHSGAAEHGMWNAVQDCLLSLVSPGDTVLDIGANIGTVTMPVAAKGARVFAYEPLADNARLLRAAVAANGFEARVTVRNVAVWETAGRLAFTGGSAWGRVAAAGETLHEAVAVDADLPGGIKVKAIKIDVEGSELQVLRGMRRLLERQRPHVVFESNSLELGRLGSSARMIFSFLETLGYRLYRLYEPKRLMRPGGLPQEVQVADFLATRLGALGLRWRTGKRVGSLRGRHLIRQILSIGDDEKYPERGLHVVAVADFLPAEVTGDERVAARLAEWRERYGKDPMLDIIRRGVFHDPAMSSPALSQLSAAE